MFFSRGSGLTSGAIAYASAPLRATLGGKLRDVPSHGGIKFNFVGDDASPVAAEAHAATDWHLLPWSAIAAKRAQDPRRRLWLVPLEFEYKELADLWFRANHQLGLWDYSVRQLFNLYLWRRGFKRPAKTAKIDCTEAVSRLVFPDKDLRCIAGVDRHDCVTPANLFAGLGRAGYQRHEVLPSAASGGRAA